MRWQGAVAATAGVLLLAGCTTIPTSGGVQVVVGQQPNNANPVVVPSGPANGATKQNIVQGFVYAQSGPSDAVAREYLTPDFAKEWNRDGGVFIQDRSLTTADAGSDGVDLKVAMTASIDRSGAYEVGDGTRTLPFTLIRVKGQWRISSCPDVVVLSQVALEQNYVSQSVRYFDPTWRRLVPDRRFFPRAAKPDRIVDALLAPLPGQSPLRGVVRSAFPKGTRSTSVSKSGNRTTVTLAVPGGTPAPTITNRMQQQIAGSLGDVGTSNLRLVVNGTVVPAAPPLAIETLYPTPFVLAAGRFGNLGPGGVSENAALGRRIVAAKPTSVTVSARQRLAAILTPTGVQIITATGSRRLADQRQVAPTIDQDGWVYSVPSDDPTALQATDARGRSSEVTALPGGRVKAIEASFDGSRMLVLVTTPAGPVAYVAGIERMPDGTPTALTTDRYPVVLTADDADDATWVDDTTVAVLTGGSDQQTVVKQQVGGLSSDLGRVPASVALAGTSSPSDPLLVLTKDTNDLYGFQPGPGSWQPISANQPQISVLAVQR